MPIVDLTDTEGKYAADVRAISGILDVIGKAEQARQNDIQRIDLMETIGQSRTQEEAMGNILDVLRKPETYSPGFSRFIQQIASGFKPLDRELTEIVGDSFIARALRLPTEFEREQQQAQIEATRALTEQRRAVATGFVTEQKRTTLALAQQRLRKAEKPTVFKLTDIKNMRAIINTSLDNIEGTPLKSLKPGKTGITQDSIIEAYKLKAAEFGYSDLSKIQQKQFDATWDTLAKRKHKRKQATLDRTLGGGKVKLGWNPNSPEVKAARRELRVKTARIRQQTRPFIEGDEGLVRPPDIRLESIWGGLTDEQKKQILTQIDQNPQDLEKIITNILARTQGATS